MRNESRFAVLLCCVIALGGLTLLVSCDAPPSRSVTPRKAPSPLAARDAAARRLDTRTAAAPAAAPGRTSGWHSISRGEGFESEGIALDAPAIPAVIAGTSSGRGKRPTSPPPPMKEVAAPEEAPAPPEETVPPEKEELAETKPAVAKGEPAGEAPEEKPEAAEKPAGEGEEEKPETAEPGASEPEFAEPGDESPKEEEKSSLTPAEEMPAEGEKAETESEAQEKPESEPPDEASEATEPAGKTEGDAPEAAADGAAETPAEETPVEEMKEEENEAPEESAEEKGTEEEGSDEREAEAKEAPAEGSEAEESKANESKESTEQKSETAKAEPPPPPSEKVGETKERSGSLLDLLRRAVGAPRGSSKPADTPEPPAPDQADPEEGKAKAAESKAEEVTPEQTAREKGDGSGEVREAGPPRNPPAAPRNTPIPAGGEVKAKKPDGAEKATIRERRSAEYASIREQERRAKARFHLREAKRLLAEKDAAGARKEAEAARTLDPALAAEVDKVIAAAGEPA